MGDRVDQQALVHLARGDHRPRVSSFEEAGGAVEPEPAFRGLRAGRMAAVAPLHQHRPDLSLEEVQPPLVAERGTGPPEDAEKKCKEGAGSEHRTPCKGGWPGGTGTRPGVSRSVGRKV